MFFISSSYVPILHIAKAVVLFGFGATVSTNIKRNDMSLDNSMGFQGQEQGNLTKHGDKDETFGAEEEEEITRTNLLATE